MSVVGAASALPYEEPSIVVILIHSSFLLLLNLLNWAIDTVLYCGLIGQILVGIAWGTPAGQLLSVEAEEVVVQLGYLGLILIVYEGGLATSFQALKANLALSVTVAATGISLPIALSFILTRLVGATNLQCFAAGAALCSTSLGTTFAVLRSSGLTTTRLGVVLASSAMLDDVIGLVMVQVISNLGSAGTSVAAVTVVRPVLVSIAFGVIAPLVCRFIVRPITVLINGLRLANPDGRLNTLFCRRETALTCHTILLIALVVGSSYAGTSNLFAAYIAGAVVSWWDSEVPHVPGRETVGALASREGASNSPQASRNGVDSAVATPSASRTVPSPVDNSLSSGSVIYEHYFYPAVKWILQPFFFASIGFSIPITRMFSGPVIWRGIVYAVLMFLGKVLCGLWLVRLPGAKARLKSVVKNFVLDRRRTKGVERGARQQPSDQATSGEAMNTIADRDTPLRTLSSPGAAMPVGQSEATAANTVPKPPNPVSLYPAAILGIAMVARGEIGFLISAVAQSNGIFGDGESGGSEIFLVVTWAILVCTIVGPFCVGLLVWRVRRLEGDKPASLAEEQNDGRLRARTTDALGVWGVY